MASTTFSSRLREDGTLAIPIEAVEALGIHPGDEIQVRLDSETEVRVASLALPTALDMAVKRMTNRTPEEIALAQQNAIANYPAERRVPDGKVLSDVVSGKWPGNETDTEIDAALRELS